MERNAVNRKIAAILMIFAMLAGPVSMTAQTQIKMPKNKYKVEEDVKAGREYSQQVEKEMPILRDTESTNYLQGVGGRLVDGIPSQFRQPAFQYSFKIVNARDINAFALPGGPMYVNRGMIDAAKNEGEMAGVMAHEISHVALRHSTAQATKQSNPLNQILGIGAVIGDAILGVPVGQTIYASVLVFPFSREYETQADTLGAQIMANAGYDPRDLANMFKTIEKESGGGGPEWLSTHPNPANRYENINREAGLVRVSNNPIRMTRGFERIQAKLRSLPKAKSMKEIDEENKRNGGGGQGSGQGSGNQTPTAGGKYETNVAYPATSTKSYTPARWLTLSAPSNWQSFNGQNELWLAPRGAYGDDGITHGALIGTFKSQSRDLATVTDEYVKGILQSNSYLRQNGGYSRITMGRRSGYSTVLSGTSPITRNVEVTTIYTVMLSDGQMLYVITVAPQNEQRFYTNAFRNLVRSVRISD